MHYVYNQYHLKNKKQAAERAVFLKKLAKSIDVFNLYCK